MAVVPLPRMSENEIWSVGDRRSGSGTRSGAVAALVAEHQQMVDGGVDDVGGAGRPRRRNRRGSRTSRRRTAARRPAAGAGRSGRGPGRATRPLRRCGPAHGATVRRRTRRRRPRWSARCSPWRRESRRARRAARRRRRRHARIVAQLGGAREQQVGLAAAVQVHRLGLAGAVQGGDGVERLAAAPAAIVAMPVEARGAAGRYQQLQLAIAVQVDQGQRGIGQVAAVGKARRRHRRAVAAIAQRLVVRVTTPSLCRKPGRPAP